MKRVLSFAAAAAVALIVGFSLAVPRGSAEEEATYVGPDACKKCHFKQHRYWKKTGLNKKSFDVLKPTTEEADKDLFAKKKKAELDPAKDYSTDATCLACHTTGYGKKGGYPENPDADDASKALAKDMASVSCEACHGAGSKYVQHKTDTMKANKDAKFTFEGLSEKGLVKPDEASCKTCHNEKNPNNAQDTFKFEDAKGAVHSKKK